MTAPNNVPPRLADGAREYFVALRLEIVEAQRLRVNVGIAKTVFLGTLLGYFFKDGASGTEVTILVCPFVALMFDCMIFGLSYNIHDIGDYIGQHLEDAMGLAMPWQQHRRRRTTRDWGRIIFRVGSYGLSFAVTFIAFVRVSSVPDVDASIPFLGRWGVLSVLLAGWILLVLQEVYQLWWKHRARPGAPSASQGS